jgi:dTDP-4-amino-4,6-dideoxygalactose transaminase
LVVNDATLYTRAETIREKGTDRSRFFRGEVDKYGWVDIGSSYLPSDLLAAFLYAQLEQRAVVERRRAELWTRYQEELGAWARVQDVRLPVVPEHCTHTSHMFYLLMPNLGRRTAFIEHMRRREILAVFHYLPLHLSTMGQRLGGKRGDCPVAESVADCLVRLPLFNSMSLEEQREVIAAVVSFDGR